MTPEQETQFAQDIGGLKANIETYHDDTKKALDLITGNGKPEDGILYIMTDVRRGIKELKDWTEEHVCETHKIIDDKIFELQNAQIDKNLAAAQVKGMEKAAEGAVILKYKWIKDLWNKVQPVLKHPVMIFMYFIAGGGGTIAWNWHNIAGSIKGLLKLIVSLAVEAYKNGGQ